MELFDNNDARGLIMQIEDTEDRGHFLNVNDCSFHSRERRYEERKGEELDSEEEDFDSESLEAMPNPVGQSANNIFQVLEDLEEDSDCSCVRMVMVVDDNQFNILPVKTLLKQHFNLEIIEAANGQLALNGYLNMLRKPCNCANRVPKFILMDIGMPVMDGKQATQLILQAMRRA